MASRIGGWAIGRSASIVAERPMRSTCAAGDNRRAGGLAAYLAGESRIDGQHAASEGWLARSRRLLAGEDSVPERGWLAIEEAKQATSLTETEEHAREALRIAHEGSLPDIECMALAQLGRAAVGQGRVEEGVTLLDEAMTVALGGETEDPLACGDACCTTLLVCDGLADLERATQWCEAVVAFNERRRFLPVQSWCRAIYAGVLVRSGDWDGAEEVLSRCPSEQGGEAKGQRAWSCSGGARGPSPPPGASRGGRVAPLGARGPSCRAGSSGRDPHRAGRRRFGGRAA